MSTLFDCYTIKSRRTRRFWKTVTVVFIIIIALWILAAILSYSPSPDMLGTMG